MIAIRKLRVVFIVLVVGISSCYSHHCSDNMSVFKDMNCDSQEDCIIEATVVFPGEWDTLYIFGGETGAEEIYFLTGYRINNSNLYISDSERFLVFKKNGNIEGAWKLGCETEKFYLTDETGNVNNVVIDRSDMIRLKYKDVSKGIVSYYLSLLKR